MAKNWWCLISHKKQILSNTSLGTFRFVNQVKLCGWTYIGATLKPDASNNASLTHLMGQWQWHYSSSNRVCHTFRLLRSAVHGLSNKTEAKRESDKPPGLLMGLSSSQNTDCEDIWMILSQMIMFRPRNGHINNLRSRINITTGYVISHDKIFPINCKIGVDGYREESRNLHMNMAQNPFQIPLTVVLKSQADSASQGRAVERMKASSHSVLHHCDLMLILGFSCERFTTIIQRFWSSGLAPGRLCFNQSHPLWLLWSWSLLPWCQGCTVSK